MKWTDEKVAILTEQYPVIGKKACAQLLETTEGSIRSKAYKLGLKQDQTSDFFFDWQSRAAQSKRGRKRPRHSIRMRRMQQAGVILRMTPDVCRKISNKAKQWHEQNDHPRGFSGKTHTPEARVKCGIASRTMWKTMTDDKLSTMKRKQMETKVRNGTYSMPRHKTTWKQGWRQIGGKRTYYRSRWEANYARYLELLKISGDIREWEHEPQTFWFDGISRGCVSYLPDFRVTNNNGSVEYHEVKGWMDSRSKTKIRRMAKYHPEVRLLVIDAKIYKGIARTASRIIKDWES